MANVQIIRRASCPAHQWSANTIEEARDPGRSSCGAGKAPSHFSKAGPSVCSGSREKKEGVADSRAQDRLYREAAGQLSGTAERASQIDERIFKRYGDARLEEISRKRGAWLSGMAEGRFKYGPVLIGWPFRNYPRRIGSWYQREIGHHGQRSHV